MASSKFLFIVAFTDFLEELSSLFSSTGIKFKSLGLILLMSEIVNYSTPRIPPNCLSLTPLSDSSIIFSLSSNDNKIYFLLEAIMSDETQSHIKQCTNMKELAGHVILTNQNEQ